MLYHLAARALLMIADEDISTTDAIDWVIRRIDRNLRHYYQLAIRQALMEVYQ